VKTDIMMNIAQIF